MKSNNPSYTSETSNRRRKQEPPTANPTNHHQPYPTSPSPLPTQVVPEPEGQALWRILKNALKQGSSIVLYVKCPVLGVHHCIGRMTRLRAPLHPVPVTIIYKQSLGRGKGFKTLAESSLIPTGFYLKARDLLKRYVGFAYGIRIYADMEEEEEVRSCTRCRCTRRALLEKVKLRDGKTRYHLSFKCPRCGSIERPWFQHYVDRYEWLVRRALSVKVLKAGGLRCRRCGEKSLIAVTKEDPTTLYQLRYTQYKLRCRRCGYAIGFPEFKESKDDEEGEGLLVETDSVTEAATASSAYAASMEDDDDDE